MLIFAPLNSKVQLPKFGNVQKVFCYTVMFRFKIDTDPSTFTFC